MPTVARLPRDIKISLNYNNHDPPHFHVVRANGHVVFRIADFQLLRGSMSRSDLLFVTAWVRSHQAELALNWVLARAKFELREIPYP
jgi:hypothetical protein